MTPSPYEKGRPGADAVPAPVPVTRPTARLVFAAAFAALGVWVAWGFLVPLGWAVLLGVALWPVYRGLLRRVPSRWPSALPPLLFTLGVALLIVVPLGFAAVQLGREGQVFVDWLGSVQQNGLPEPPWVERVPLAGNSIARWWREHLAQPQQLSAWLAGVDRPALANWTKLVGARLLHLGFLFFVTMLALFFVFRDGQWLGRRLLEQADRILGHSGEQVTERVAEAARGTFNGTVLVAVGEGVLIGIGYVVAGVPEPILFGGLTIGFAMLPFGAWFAFTAAALVLLSVGGGVLAAALLFAWGGAIMLAGDNFVQPKVIGSSVRLPFLWAFIGIFGGIESFGLIGLFLGPTIMSGVITIWREWIDQPRRARGSGAPMPASPARRWPGSSDPADLIP